DVPFIQDYSIKYNNTDPGAELYKVYSDRNGVVKILSSKGLMQPYSGEMLYPGTIVTDQTYRPITAKKISGIGLYKSQFVFIDDKAVLSNAWAGKLFSQHSLPDASIFAGGEDFNFLISNGKKLELLKNSQTTWQKDVEEAVIDIVYDSTAKNFFILTSNEISIFSLLNKTYTSFFKADSLTSFAIGSKGKEIIAGTHNGYIILDVKTRQQKGEINRKLPATDITAVAELNGKLWFGSKSGAFMLRADGKFNYYASKRWLPSDNVKHIAEGSDGSVLILTDKGLGKICFEKMTLADKAAFFEKQVRQRHIRNGFNAALTNMKEGDLGTGFMEDSDNDGLWTSMYLAAEAFRYAVTKSPDALQNCRESLDAMERLYSINSVKGFPARSFERKGFPVNNVDKWIPSYDPEWEWKSTTSSDEAIGHIFVFAVIAELVKDEPMKKKSIVLIDSLMQHIIDNDLYLIDWDGKPTQWGKWNPDYVNARPEIVGDRKINSSNLTAMLQTAYHFTKKEIYKEKAFELFNKYGYLKNLMQPMKEVGKAPETADDWSKMLSESWNHSDDEMYFLGYWGLYRYAFNDTLKKKFKDAIIDHWEIERPEKEAAWNIVTAITGKPDFDLKESIWYLQEYPLDLIVWSVHNSDRKDIEPIAPNFRNQTIKEVLPPDELRISRHNANRFSLNGGSNGRDEESAGDIWLLPYWMGRYLGVISSPGK
ncbi:MAG: hypothetical protein ABUT20_14345, partial [Bacteroidota bacterium]